MGYNFAFEVDKTARQTPDKTAVYCVREYGEIEQLSYDELRRRSNQLARALMTNGIHKGSRVLVLLPKGMEPYIVYLALLKTGATVMPGSEMLRSSDIRYRVHHAGATAVIAHHTLTGEVDDSRVDCPTLTHFYSVGSDVRGWTTLASLVRDVSDADLSMETEDSDIAFLSYTSGTTGAPRVSFTATRGRANTSPSLGHTGLTRSRRISLGRPLGLAGRSGCGARSYPSSATVRPRSCTKDVFSRTLTCN
ncbi:hypothetical protein GCM10025859_54200 [Alicyclobacillus fastidiosus]|nr:hypothetical protein GCM10025859_54200 [Alicyclobacillus fastidiosus]